MKFCWCTVGSTNPEVCKSCSNGNYATTTELLVNWKDVFSEYWDFKTYNPETHELVEKKDAKIKRLKDEINKEKQRVQTCKTVIDAYASNIKEAEDNIKKLKQELKELES